MNILDTITAHKRKEVAQRKAKTSFKDLEQRRNFSLPVRSLSDSLISSESTGIIAEFKRKSPSKGYIKQNADVVEITKAYTSGGAACLSVLTDEHFFGGADEDLINARIHKIPILRKDFIVDEYQIVEAKSIGADVILLIAACLTPQEVNSFSRTAAQLGLQMILELHSENELKHICDATNIIGINNRDLKTFNVDIERSLKMAEKLPSTSIKIAESGIDSIDDILLFKKNGFSGFLIGEYFMKQENTPKAFDEFIIKLRTSLDAV